MLTPKQQENLNTFIESNYPFFLQCAFHLHTDSDGVQAALLIFSTQVLTGRYAADFDWCAAKQWVRGIIRNVGMKEFRDKCRESKYREQQGNEGNAVVCDHSTHAADGGPVAGRFEATPALDVELRDTLKVLCSRLTKRQSQIFEARYIQGMGKPETMAQLRLKENAYKTALRRLHESLLVELPRHGIEIATYLNFLSNHDGDASDDQ